MVDEMLMGVAITPRVIGNTLVDGGQALWSTRRIQYALHLGTEAEKAVAKEVLKMRNMWASQAWKFHPRRRGPP